MVGTVELEKLNTETRLTQVEVDTKLIRSDITTIKNNHLKHIEKSMDSMDKKIEKLDTRIWAILFGIVMLAISNVMATIYS
jgi:hypothetical protein